MDPAAHNQLDQAMAAIAREVGATVHAYPRPGRAVRHIVLRDLRDDRGTRSEVAQIEKDGTLRIIGHDTGPRVSEFWGADITSYEWTYIVAAQKVAALLTLLGGQEGDDILSALGAYHEHHGGQINDLLRTSEVAADFSNWHS
jgi:hypothetical protein